MIYMPHLYLNIKGITLTLYLTKDFKVLKKVFLCSLLGIIFICGLAAGAYRTFPYHEFKAVRDFILSKDKSEKKSFETPHYLHKTSFYKLLTEQL